MTKQKQKTTTPEQYSRDHIKRRRGRPADGFEKALHYTRLVEQAIRLGRRPTQAVRHIAEGLGETETGMTPEHIWACIKRVRDAGIRKEDFEFRAGPKPRGRPAMDLRNACLYVMWYNELIRLGWPPTAAVRAVAKKFQKTPAHIWRSRKLVADEEARRKKNNNPYPVFEDD